MFGPAGDDQGIGRIVAARSFYQLPIAIKLDAVDLTDVATEEEAVALVAERAKSVPEGEWILGAGWDEGAWANRYPDKALLTAKVPDHPVFMDSLHGFAGWGNQLALDEAGITATSVTYNAFSFRHVDAMGSGRFFYASEPKEVVVALRK